MRPALAFCTSVKLRILTLIMTNPMPRYRFGTSAVARIATAWVARERLALTPTLSRFAGEGERFRSALELLDLGDQRGDRFLPGVDEAVIRDLEDRLVGILVDRDDHLRSLHPGQVLDRA